MSHTINHRQQVIRPQIFLDINGVLETSSLYAEGLSFDPQCVDAINSLIDRYNPEIIITSSWRVDYSLNALREWFERESVRGEIIDVTPYNYVGSKTRGGEIQMWREQNNAGNTPMLVLEDCADIAPYDICSVITDSDIGLTQEDVEKAIFILDKQIAYFSSVAN